MPEPDLIALELGLIVQAFEATLGGRRVPYAACPITGGPRYYEWLYAKKIGRSVGDQLSTVTLPNIRAAREEISRLRAQLAVPVIDPTQIEAVTSWDQGHFYGLWRQVFDRYVSSLVLLQGWEQSTGCLKEAAMAFRLGLPVTDHTLDPLPLTKILPKVMMAIVEIERRGLPVEDLQDEAAELETLARVN